MSTQQPAPKIDAKPPSGSRAKTDEGFFDLNSSDSANTDNTPPSSFIDTPEDITRAFESVRATAASRSKGGKGCSEASGPGSASWSDHMSFNTVTYTAPSEWFPKASYSKDHYGCHSSHESHGVNGTKRPCPSAGPSAILQRLLELETSCVPPPDLPPHPLGITPAGVSTSGSYGSKGVHSSGSTFTGSVQAGEILQLISEMSVREKELLQLLMAIEERVNHYGRGGTGGSKACPRLEPKAAGTDAGASPSGATGSTVPSKDKAAGGPKAGQDKPKEGPKDGKEKDKEKAKPKVEEKPKPKPIVHTTTSGIFFCNPTTADEGSPSLTAQEKPKVEEKPKPIVHTTTSGIFFSNPTDLDDGSPSLIAQGTKPTKAANPGVSGNDQERSKTTSATYKIKDPKDAGKGKDSK